MELVDSVDELRSSPSVSGKFCKFRDAGREDCFGEAQLRGAGKPKRRVGSYFEDRSPSRSTATFE